jgi:hypothetical protein
MVKPYDKLSIKDFKGVFTNVEAHPDMTREQYDATEGINQSFLKDVLAVSPSYALHSKNNREATPAMSFGIALHAYVLEVNEFNRKVAVKPDGIDRRTKEGKIAYEEFLVESHGKTIITQDDLNKIQLMRDNAIWLIEHKKARKSTNELSITAQFKVTEGPFAGVVVPIKAQLDTLHELDDVAVIRDLKSVADISDVPKASRNGGWAVQSALYGDLVAELTHTHVSFEYVASSKEPPHDARKYLVSPEMEIRGRSMYLDGINRYLWWAKNGKPNTAEFLGTEVLNF